MVDIPLVSVSNRSIMATQTTKLLDGTIRSTAEADMDRI